MANGIFTINNSDVTARLVWETTMDIAANTSTWTATVQVKGKSSSTSSRSFTGVVNLKGYGSKSISSRVSYNSSQWYYVASVSFTVPHEADGTRSADLYWSFASASTGLVEDTIVFDTIPRASSVTCSTADIGKAPTITITRATDVFTHTLKYTFGQQSGVIVEKTPLVVYNSWIIPLSLYNEIPTEMTGEGTITCETYSGNTLVGTSTCPFTANGVEEDCNPVFTPSVYDTNETTYALTGDRNRLIRYYSNAFVVVGAQARYSATLTSQYAYNGERYFYAASGDFTEVENGVFNLYATDSRGCVSSTMVTKTLVEYVKLTCNFGRQRPDTQGNYELEIEGNYWVGNFGTVDNTLTVEYRRKTSTGSWGNWITLTPTITGNTYRATDTITGLDYKETYIFEARAVDKLNTISTGEMSIQSTPVFHWGSDNFVFEVPVVFNAGTEGASLTAEDGDQTIDGDLLITGDLRLKGDGNYGNKILMGDGTYVSFSENTDDALTIKATRINLEANGIYAYDEPLIVSKSGTWTPVLDNVSATYTTQAGWYSKTHQGVSLGWFIKANVGSGYSSNTISISGCPFTPIWSASGGGMCSGAYVTGGFNFQSWVLGTDSTITPRVQSCNSTSAANLSTSASGCFYRSGGGEITLSGSITFYANS